MCGIAGVFNCREDVKVSSILRALQHRGPDDSGYFQDDNTILLHSRLSIIDPSAEGHQPMATDDGQIQIIFNGEIYNHRRLRTMLEEYGYRFHSTSDTEVLLRMYQKFGVESFSMLAGIFSFAIYDRRSHEPQHKLILCRDHFGVKPLLYSSLSQGLVFASEIKALLATGLLPRRVDSQSLQRLLTLGYVPAPRTIIENVFSLPPGSFLEITSSTKNLIQYWKPGLDRFAGLREMPYESHIEVLHKALACSVQQQVLADVPVGAFLSGGVDSSLVVAMMTKNNLGAVKTFSVGFEDPHNTYDESGAAEEMARYLSTDHHKFMISSTSVSSHLQSFVRALDQPSIDGLNSYFVSMAASGHVKVALSGTGCDELFLGYPWFSSLISEATKATVHRSTQLITSRLNSRLRRVISRILPDKPPIGQTSDVGLIPGGLYDRYGRQHYCYSPDDAMSILSEDRRAQVSPATFASIHACSDHLASGSLLERSSSMCIHGYLQGQLLRDIDACSMFHALEVRVPFLDPVLSDIAFSLPVSSKLSPEDSDGQVPSYNSMGVKRIICDIARHYLPNHFFADRQKHGFILPIDSWLRDPLSDCLADALSGHSVQEAGLFCPKQVKLIYDEYLQGKRPWTHPWLLMITQMWCRLVLHAHYD